MAALPGRAFEELLQQPGVREVVELRSPFGFLAFHGGSLERMTDVIAAEAAARAGSSLYSVVQPPELRWHIPSHLVTRHASASLDAFLNHVRLVVALHGFGRAGRWTQLLLGGVNRPLAAHLRHHLAPALPDYQVIDDLERMPLELRGLHPTNPVNLPAEGGVQLELPPRVRGLTQHWRHWSDAGRPPPVEALIDGLAAAALAWA
jgi:phage replication-related protein YjqB (UPF0714/DUF867 family)